MTAHFVDLLDQLRRRSLRMSSLVQDILDEACAAVLDSDSALAVRVIERDNDVDAEEVEVEKEVIRLMALYQPVGSDLRMLCTVLKVNNDLERIADCAVNMAERAKHLVRDSVREVMPEINRLCVAVQETLRKAIAAYSTEDPAAAHDLSRDDHLIDATYVDIIRDTMAVASENPEYMASHLDILSVAKNLERIADHAANIAEDVVFLSTGKIVRHQSVGEQG